ncbi:uncharacterized protein F4817DRAFT_348930 [Daldinia loculata]|uniref:uncharacterized protein n=1 Tax=Daldinia loculata TaxID=103429 RepID=UPI0020C26DA5|nr:uncharacterized protein F4817DRAFT_348930 [Daldinia loculata]KAI1643643.1 hypothetical protein F4817DRAFT_348930 [Daldinia loculata]
MPGDEIKHPTPAEAFKLAADHAALLRGLFLDPRYKYLQDPTPTFIKPNLDETPAGLYFVSDFVQRTYVEYVVPFLPAGATRKCKAIANPWAWNDPTYPWEWEWDEQTSTLKDKDGNVIDFPKLPEAEAVNKMGDVLGRGFMARKIILENRTDIKARLMVGGQPFDFGKEVEDIVKETYPF